MRAGIVASQLDYDALKFISAAGITNATQKFAINYLAFNLKLQGLWSKMYAIYPIVGGNATAHSYNLVNTANYRITFFGTITHSANGMVSDGTTGYGLTGLIPSSVFNTTNFSSASFYSRTNITNSGSPYVLGSFGTNTNPGAFAMTIRANNSSTVFVVDSASITNRSAVNSAQTDSRGLFAGSQNGTNIKIYRNGSDITVTQGATASQNPSNTELAVLTYNNTSGAAITDWITPLQCAFMHVGQKLTDAENTTLYNIVQQYQTLLSRNV